ncbi:MAG: MFS transporter [Actinoplanes sp.]
MRALSTESDIAELPKRFPDAVRLLLAGEVVTALGVGLTQPYAVVLLHAAHGMSLPAATGLWALGPVAALVGNPVGGALIDRRGARPVMVAGLAMVAAGALLLAYGPGLVAAAGGIALNGLGWSFSIPALSTRLAILAPESIRSRVYTLQYVFFNLGMAIGAAMGGLAFVNAPPATSTGRAVLPLLWVAAAFACLVGIVLAMLAGRQPPPEPAEELPRGGYRRALGDGTFIRVLGASLLLATVGFGIYDSAASVLALAADDPAALSFASVANCATIVVGSPIALRLTARISAHAALLATAVLWALAWAVCIPTVMGAGLSTRTALTSAAILIGAGELLFAGALPTLVNAIAPETLRGRYNALSDLSLTIGMVAGPLLTSAAAAGNSIVYLLYTAIALTGLASILLLRTQR